MEKSRRLKGYLSSLFLLFLTIFLFFADCCKADMGLGFEIIVFAYFMIALILVFLVIILAEAWTLEKFLKVTPLKASFASLFANVATTLFGFIIVKSRPLYDLYDFYGLDNLFFLFLTFILSFLLETLILRFLFFKKGKLKIVFYAVFLANLISYTILFLFINFENFFLSPKTKLFRLAIPNFLKIVPVAFLLVYQLFRIIRSEIRRRKELKLGQG